MAAFAGPPGVGHFRLDLGTGSPATATDGYRGRGGGGLDDAFQDAHGHQTGRGPGQHGGQFGILAPTTMPGGIEMHQNEQQQQQQHHGGLAAASGRQDTGERAMGKLGGRIVVDPPDLQAWRERLFNVDEMIVLTHDQFETYFPHVDNVYSHRSTQRYKRKSFVSHYWDCRMKGRPPGTPKAADPRKKTRRRSARERDLCDVKIRVTEYLPAALPSAPDGGIIELMDRETAAAAAAAGVPPGQRFWTIQRVNGNGGNGKGDGVAGPHRHSLDKSDEIKRNSVQRWVAQRDRDMKKVQVPSRKATGAALATVKKHSKDSDLKLYAACFCPYSQRVWIALEAKRLAYQYCETDPYRRPAPTPLLEANPRGLVPALRQGEWACAESAVILEYLEDLDSDVPLHPSDPRLKANCRLWVDHINTRVVPAFYALLQARDVAQQSASTERLQNHITSLVLAADEHGPFFLGASLSLVDVHFAPFALRLSRVLRPLRGWADPVPGTRWQRWLDALERDPHVVATTCLGELYAETAEVLAGQAAPLPPYPSRPA